MKKNLPLGLVMFLFCCQSVLAQTAFYSEPVVLKGADTRELLKSITDYKVVKIDVKALRNFSRGKQNNINFLLGVEGYDWKIELEENNMKSPSYHTVENGKVFSAINSPGITYKGYLNNDTNQPVRLTISDDLFEGYVTDKNEMILIKPLSKIITNYPNREHYVVFNSKDLVDDGSVIPCGVQEVQLLKNTELEMSENFAIASASTTCRFLEIATEADYEFYQDNGSNVSTANNNIISILNQVEGIYQSTFNIRFLITYQSVWSTSNDPYTAAISTTSNAVVDELANWWIGNRSNVSRDIVYFFSAKTAHDVKGSSRQVGAVCANYANSYAFTATRKTNDIAITTAHEIGHLFSATHPADNSTSCTPTRTIMCVDPNNLGRVLQFSAASQTQINNWINNNEACLIDLASVSVTGPHVICTSGAYSISGLPSGSSVSGWSSNNANLSIVNGTATRLNNFNGSATTTVTGTIGSTGCTFTTSKTVAVGSFTSSEVTVSGQAAVCPYWEYVYTANIFGGHQAGYTYTWTYPSGWIVYAQGGNQIRLYVPGNASYGAVRVSVNNGCGASAYTGITVYPGYCGAFSVYPNPADEEINIEEINNGKFAVDGVESEIDVTETQVSPKDNFLVKLFNEKQVEVKAGTSINRRVVLDVSKLEAGTYFLHIYYSGKIQKGQIVIK